MKAVWKFALATPGSTMVHDIPAGASFAHVDWQEHEPFPAQAWFVVDLDVETERRQLELVPTGHPFAGDYLGTFVHQESQTVWHLIER